MAARGPTVRPRTPISCTPQLRGALPRSCAHHERGARGIAQCWIRRVFVHLPLAPAFPLVSCRPPFPTQGLHNRFKVLRHRRAQGKVEPPTCKLGTRSSSGGAWCADLNLPLRHGEKCNLAAHDSHHHVELVTCATPLRTPTSKLNSRAVIPSLFRPHKSACSPVSLQPESRRFAAP